MHRKIGKIGCAFLFLLVVTLLFNTYTFSQQLAVKKQTDGTIKIQSTPSKMKVRVESMVYCRTIDELIKEEKDNLNRLITDNRYDEVKDSVEIIQGLRQLKMQKCE
jgi:hypothetical protein